MRKYIIPAFVALLAIAPGASFAATAAPAASIQADQSIMGTIKSVNMIARSLELSDGSRYFLPLTFKDPGLKAGEKVTVHWKLNGTAQDVTSVSIG